MIHRENTEKISIVVPIYNSSSYLSKCIDSLIGQTYSNLDILLIDDGSTDDSLAICEKYMNQNNGIRVIAKENTGVADTRNRGIKEAKGEYVIFVDSDDYIEATMIEKLYNKMVENNADVAMCGFNRVDEEKIVAIEESNLVEKDFSSDSLTDFIKCFFINEVDGKLVDNIMGSSCRCLVKKNILIQNHIFFPNIKYMEDLIYCIKLFSHIQRLAVVKECLYNYRDNHSSVTRTFSIAVIDDRIKFLDIMIPLIDGIFRNDAENREKISKFVVQREIMFFMLLLGQEKTTRKQRKKIFRQINNNTYIKKYNRLTLSTSTSGIIVSLYNLKAVGLYKCLINIRNMLKRKK